jgi:hypothetical protein
MAVDFGTPSALCRMVESGDVRCLIYDWREWGLVTDRWPGWADDGCGLPDRFISLLGLILVCWKGL